MAKSKPVSRAMATLITAALVFASLIGLGAPAQAVTNQNGTTNYTTIFYAYVAKGERLQITAAGHAGATVLNENGANTLISGGYTPAAGSDGVWRVTLRGSYSDNPLGFTYNVSVRAGTTEKPGRVWMDTDTILQNGVGDLNYFGVSDLGYIYQINMKKTHPINATIALRSSGAAPDGQCDVQSKSFDNLTAYMDCGDTYKLFLEDPRGKGLPATAKMGSETIQVLPNPVTTAQLTSSTKVVFTANTDKPGGSFALSSHPNFSGTAELQIDTNNNGVYTDAVDVEKTVVFNQGKAAAWKWNGKNGSNVDVLAGAKARVVISKSAEAHLLLKDFEAFAGLTMSRLNGDAPNSTIYWDDSALTSKKGGNPTPVKTCLGGCNSNVAAGVHGWNEGTALPGDTESRSWGDGRIIDNWAYVGVNATSPVITLPAVYTLNFDGNGGTIDGPVSITKPFGAPWGALPTATQKNNTFLGWYTARTGGTQVTSATIASVDTLVFAQWRPAQFNVVFYGNAQMGKITGTTASMMVAAGCADCRLTPNGFTKTTGALAMIEQGSKETAEVNSTFLGWSLDPLSHKGDIAERAVAGALSQTDGATVKLYAIWDDAPHFIVESYPNRFVSLDAAKAGEVTETELLRTVKATDKETNPLIHKTAAEVISSGNDVGVTLYDYNASDFTSMTDSGTVTLTYKVRDEAWNTAFLRIHVTVSNGEALAPQANTYLRGFAPKFADQGSEAGGLSADSLWRTDPTRKALLDQALNGSAGTTYCLDSGAVNTLRTQAQDNGLGNSQDASGLSAAVGVLRGQGACK